jgi:hypothetical protein
MMTKIGSEVMLWFLQDWGQSVEKRIATLNMAAKAANINATFRQGPNGENAGWEGPDESIAVNFRHQIENVWCGEFNKECRNVEAIIEKFKNRKAILPEQE